LESIAAADGGGGGACGGSDGATPDVPALADSLWLTLMAVEAPRSATSTLNFIF
jgi:hypothetical protein